ncbi:hypothetical protein [Almyronema epifaneia]|uniref:Uncharacterized protein n=1 Tax=Almyronema epifaneia S1 TaxID=2991925 RepID=A0ABW6IE24_9CYAN
MLLTRETDKPEGVLYRESSDETTVILSESPPPEQPQSRWQIGHQHQMVWLIAHKITSHSLQLPLRYAHLTAFPAPQPAPH